MKALARAIAYKLRTRPVLGRLALKLVPDARIRVQIDGIGPFVVRLRTNRSYWLRNPLTSEHFPFAMLSRLVRPGDVVYDAGANMGLYCRFFAGPLGAGRVIAFEPMSANRPMLAKNLVLGGIEDRVTVLPLALSDADEETLFQVDDMQSSSGTLDKVTHGEACVGRKNLALPPLTERVAARRLDTVIREHALPPPAVIKIDVEGAEALVLRGAENALRTHRPKLFVELHGAEEARAVLGFLLELGYHCRGTVGAHIHASGFGDVDASTLPRIEGMYDLHFLVAAMDAAELPSSYDAAAPLSLRRAGGGA